jgi:glutathione synthase/RimK-type ligase-like ATP-grasp enzyme
VYRCADVDALVHRLDDLRDRPWFRRHGALVQEAVENHGRDLRVVVAAGRVVGAGERTAAPGEWRTNVSCGGDLHPTELDPDAAELARAAAAAVGADLVGVDLMPTRDGRLVVLELNGAVEFDDACTIGGRGVAERAADALGLVRVEAAAR